MLLPVRFLLHIIIPSRIGRRYDEKKKERERQRERERERESALEITFIGLMVSGFCVYIVQVLYIICRSHLVCHR